MSREFLHLKALARLINTFGARRSQTIDFNEKEDRQHAYFRAILDDGIQNESDLPTPLTSPGIDSNDHRVLRSSVKKRMMNSLFHLELDTSGASEYRKTFYGSQREVFMAKTLVLVGLRTLADRVAERAANVARQYVLTSNELELQLMLQTGAALDCQSGRYDAITQRIEELYTTLGLEMQAKNLYESIVLMIAATEELDPTLNPAVTKKLQRLAELEDASDSFPFKLSIFRAQAIGEEALKMYKEELVTCRKAEQFLTSHPHLNSPSYLGEFGLRRMMCAYHLNDKEEIERSRRECHKCYSVGDSNWFNYKLYDFYISLHALDFEMAAEVLRDATSNASFATQAELKRHQWELVRSYVRFASGQVHTEAQLRSELKNLRLHAKTATKLKRDKRGFNFDFVILEILILLQLRDFSAVEKKLAGLKIYRHRYLNRDKRGALFADFLIALAEDPIPSERKLKKLRSMIVRMKDISKIEPTSESEVCPYWHLAEQSLQE